MDASPSCDEYRAVAEETAGGTIVARSNGACNWSLRAIPEPGYEFSQWSDGNTSNPRHVTISPGDDISYTAEFVRAPFVKRVYNGDYGTVTAVQVEGCLNKWTLTATPNSNYAFKEWSDGSTENPHTVTLVDNYSVQSFDAIFYEDWCAGKTINADKDASDLSTYDGDGTVTIARCNCEVYLTAVPASGSVFVGWSDGNTDNPRVIELVDPEISSYTYKARFVLASSMTCNFFKHTSDGGHGEVVGVQNPLNSCEWELTAAPEVGWEFTRWNDGNTENPRTVTLDPLKAHISYKATFTYVACKPFRAVIDYNSPRGGTVTVTRSDCNWTLTATPDADYEFAGWTNGSYENPMIVIIDNPSITSLTHGAKFRKYSCNYNTAVSEGQGTITAVRKTCDPTCVYTITAVPNAGYVFTKWSDENTDNPRDITINTSVDPVTKVSYASYTALFEDVYCRNVRDVHTDCEGGTIVATRRNGCEWVLTAVPANSNYEFICWDDGSTGNPRIINFERESTDSFEWSAKFAPCRYYTVMKSGSEFGTITATQDADDGCTWTLTTVAKDGWEFYRWSDGSEDEEHEISTDGTAFDFSVEYKGTYNKDFRSTVHNPAGGGLVTATGCNYTWTLTAVPDTEHGYQFAGWEDGSIINPRTFDIDPSEPVHEYEALFMIPDGRIDGWTYNGLEITTSTTDIMDGGSTARANVYADETLVAENAAVTKKDWGRWLVAFNPSVLNTHAGEPLHLRVFDECDQLSCAIDTVVPIVITNNTQFSTLSAPDNVDVQVVRGVLSVDVNAVLGELDIYANAQVSLPSGKSLSVQHVYMRGNGPGAAYPKFSVNGSLTNANKDTIYYDYTLDYSAYYPLAIPYTVACNKIRTKTNNTPLYEVSWYNGDDRAMNETGWTVYDDTADGARINAGQGYTIFAVPENWRNEPLKMQSTVVLRFPMKVGLASGESEKTVPVEPHNYEGVTNESNKNWNLIGNPYLTDYSHYDDEKLMEIRQYILNPSGVGYSESETGVPLRYLTWSVDGHRTYIQNRVTETTMSAFRTYFVQVDLEEAGVLNFPLSGRANAPRRPWMTNEPEEEVAKEYELGVVLSGDSLSDRTGILYGERFTQGYEMNADLVKMFGSHQPMSLYSVGGNGEPRAYNALPAADAMQPVPLGFRNAPQGTMQIAFDSAHYDASMFEAVYLLDYETGNTTNLLDEPYIFRNTQNSSDTRFALFASLSTKPHTPTGTDVIIRDVQGIEVYDMLGRRVSISFDNLPQGVYVVVQDGEPRKEVVK